MRPLVFVRPLSGVERELVEAGLRSSDAFTLRRSQIILASAEEQHVPRIAAALHCAEETVRLAIRRFNQEGPASLTPRSRRPHTIHAVMTPERREQLRELVHCSPRDLGKPTSVWTLELLAEVAFEQGITERRMTYEGIRDALGRLGLRWQRAKGWITSPDAAYDRKKGDATG